MDGVKILEVINLYRKHFEEQDIGKSDFPLNLILNSSNNGLVHCHCMLEKMEKFVKEGRIEKAFRWLGFVQGCLWSAGHYSLEDLMDHSRPRDEK